MIDKKSQYLIRVAAIIAGTTLPVTSEMIEDASSSVDEYVTAKFRALDPLLTTEEEIEDAEFPMESWAAYPQDIARFAASRVTGNKQKPYVPELAWEFDDE